MKKQNWIAVTKHVYDDFVAWRKQVKGEANCFYHSVRFVEPPPIFFYDDAEVKQDRSFGRTAVSYTLAWKQARCIKQEYIDTKEDEFYIDKESLFNYCVYKTQTGTDEKN